MKRKSTLLLVAVILTLLCFQVPLHARSDEPDARKSGQPSESAMDAAQKDQDKQETALEMLRSIVQMKANLVIRMAEKKKQIRQSESDAQKEELTSELTQLDKQLAAASRDFERIATGVDNGAFTEKKTERFDWKNELVSLMKPGIMEIKRLTAKAREKTQLRDQLSTYEDLMPLAVQARIRVEALAADAENPSLKKELEKLLPEYRGMETQISNKLNLVRLQLGELEQNEISLLESSKNSIKRFFKTRGLFIFIAIVASLGVVLVLRACYRLFIKMVPGYSAAYRPFHIRAFELIYRILIFLMALLAVILVFYIFEDWVLLSLAVIALMGVAWAAKNTLPRFVHQSRLMLNIGAVREGERMMYQGVPWLVKQINFYSTLENPDLDIRIRLPIEALLDRTSRTFHPSESWFPCRKNDWVILSDGIRGCVTALSHEMVELVMRGGARKTYQTEDFLSLAPLNLSMNFRLKVSFGISYTLQKEATGRVPDQLTAFIESRMEEEGYTKDLLNLRVEFASAGSSSLDLVVIADFNGSRAPLYNRITRAIQRWCVDAATLHGWEIPFPQLDIHQKN